MSNPGLRHFLVSAAALGLAAAALPAVADEALTPWAPPAWRSSDDCPVASRRFDYRDQAAPAAPAPVAALGAPKLRPLVASPCARGPVARDL
jgi:hypothetical protein